METPQSWSLRSALKGLKNMEVLKTKGPKSMMTVYLMEKPKEKLRELRRKEKVDQGTHGTNVIGKLTGFRLSGRIPKEV